MSRRKERKSKKQLDESKWVYRAVTKFGLEGRDSAAAYGFWRLRNDKAMKAVYGKSLV